MTINVALVTTEALILGCDSIASSTGYFLDAFQHYDRNDDGSTKFDDEGRIVARFRPDDVRQLVTTSWGGVTKMFQIHVGACRVAAVTAGLAKLNNLNMSALAAEFAEQNVAGDGVSVIAQSFLEFMRAQFDQHYAGSPLPEKYRSGPVLSGWRLRRCRPVPFALRDRRGSQLTPGNLCKRSGGRAVGRPGGRGAAHLLGLR
jgi:hypothetical protein